MITQGVSTLGSVMYNAHVCDINYNSRERKKRMSERIILDRRFGGGSSSVELVIVPKSAYFVSRCITV